MTSSCGWMAVIKSRVLGPPNSEVVLKFQGDRRVFKVTLLRTAVVEHRKDGNA